MKCTCMWRTETRRGHVETRSSSGFFLLFSHGLPGHFQNSKYLPFEMRMHLACTLKRAARALPSKRPNGGEACLR